MKSKRLKTIGVTFVLIAIIVLCVVWVANIFGGKIVITNTDQTSIKSSSLTCISGDIKYPFFEYDNSTKKQLKIIASFFDNSLKVITLNYELNYDDVNEINRSEAQNHAAMNISFGKNGFSTDAFNANYTKMSDSFRFSLFTEGSNINSNSGRYFMMNTEELPTTLQQYKTFYSGVGFRCVIED